MENKKLREKLVKRVSKEELKRAVSEGISDFFTDDEDMIEYTYVSVVDEEKYFLISVGAEVDYDELERLADYLNDYIREYDDEAYFEPADPGLLEAYLWRSNINETLKKKNKKPIKENLKLNEDRSRFSSEKKTEVLKKIFRAQANDELGAYIRECEERYSSSDVVSFIRAVLDDWFDPDDPEFSDSSLAKTLINNYEAYLDRFETTADYLVSHGLLPENLIDEDGEYNMEQLLEDENVGITFGELGCGNFDDYQESLKLQREFKKSSEEENLREAIDYYDTLTEGTKDDMICGHYSDDNVFQGTFYFELNGFNFDDVIEVLNDIILPEYFDEFLNSYDLIISYPDEDQDSLTLKQFFEKALGNKNPDPEEAMKIIYAFSQDSDELE